MSEGYKNKKYKPREYFYIKRSEGGLGPVLKSEGKIWARSPTKGKIWEVLVLQKTKIGTESREYNAHENSQRSTTRILGSYLKFKGQNLEYLSRIFLEAKFGALKFGAKPARPLNVEVPLPPESTSIQWIKKFCFPNAHAPINMALVEWVENGSLFGAKGSCNCNKVPIRVAKR